MGSEQRWHHGPRAPVLCDGRRVFCCPAVAAIMLIYKIPHTRLSSQPAKAGFAANGHFGADFSRRPR